MLEIHKSDAKPDDPNPLFKPMARRKNEDNIAWLDRAFGEGPDTARIVLLGGTSTESFRLRVAQSHARQDLTPSHWSHVILLRGRKTTAATRVWEIALEGSQPLGFPPATNGVSEGRLRAYYDPRRYPNVAAIRIPVAQSEIDEAVQRFRGGRAILDAVEMMVPWLAYLWGVGDAGNPLLAGYGVPSAALVEYAAGAVDYELTPGLASRSSCPEAIWQSAKWWYGYHQEEGRPDAGRCLSGAWLKAHVLE